MSSTDLPRTAEEEPLAEDDALAAPGVAPERVDGEAPELDIAGALRRMVMLRDHQLAINGAYAQPTYP